MDKDVIQLFLKQYISNFVTYELSPGICSIKDISKAVYAMSDHERTLKIEYDGIRMKTKLILTPFSEFFGKLRFDEKPFVISIFGFPAFWDYKLTNATHADSPGACTNQKFSNLSRIDKIHLKCDVIDGSVLNRLRQLILFSFL